MKRIIKIVLNILLIIIVLVIVFLLLKKDSSNKGLSIDNYNIIHETKFGGVYIKITIDDFNKLGFKFGDSVDIIFSNGYKLLDQPYYNGYYVDMGESLLIGYPGYDYIKVAVNYGDDLWVTADLKEDDTATIKLNEKTKYLKIQNARDIHYPEEQGDLSDIKFANFRNVKVGKIKDNILYRGASPIDNSHNRAPVADRLIKETGINYDIDLSDSDEDLVKHIHKDDFNSLYFMSLYTNKKVIALSMNMQFKEEGLLLTKEQKEDTSYNILLQMKELSFGEKLVKGLTAMSENDGPYYIHCVEGKDRTGYVLMVLEALTGSTYQEIIDDYMITYDNYYDINKDSDIDRYETIKEKNIDVMLHYIIGDNDNKVELSKINDYSEYAKKYLLALGMEEEKINKLINNLTV